MFDEQYNKIITQQVLSSLDQRYKNYIVRYLSNQQIFKKYLNLGYEISDQQMYNMLLDTYETDKITAIISMLAWKTITLKRSYYIVLTISNQKQYYDGTLNVSFLRYDLKTAKLNQTIYQIYGQNKAIYYSMLKSRKSIDYIFNFIQKQGMCLL